MLKAPPGVSISIDEMRVSDDYMYGVEDLPIQERESLKGMFGKPAKTVSIEEMNAAIATQGAKAGQTPQNKP